MAKVFEIPAPGDAQQGPRWVESRSGEVPDEERAWVAVEDSGVITLFVGSPVVELDAGGVSLRRLFLVLAREPLFRGLMQEALDRMAPGLAQEEDRALELQDELRGMDARLVGAFRAGSPSGHGEGAFSRLVAGLRLNAVAATLGSAKYTAWASLTRAWRAMDLPEHELVEWKRKAGHVETPG